MKTIAVNGMHCEACKTLISMEIEELGLKEKVDSINLESDNNGKIAFTEITDEELKSVVEAVNNIGDYNAEII